MTVHMTIKNLLVCVEKTQLAGLDWLGIYLLFDVCVCDITGETSAWNIQLLAISPPCVPQIWLLSIGVIMNLFIYLLTDAAVHSLYQQFSISDSGWSGFVHMLFYQDWMANEHQLDSLCNQSHLSVLFFSRPRSEGWPHHGCTFSIYLCPLSFWLSTSWCCPSRQCVVFLACVHLTLFLAWSLSLGNYYFFFWPRYSILREEKLCYAKTRYENKLEWSLLLLLLHKTIKK